MKQASATAPITLGTLATDAGIQVGPFGSQLHVSDYSKNGVAVVMPAQIDGETIRFDECARIQETKAESLNAHRLIPGDIVFARRGDIGRLAVVPHGAASAICGTGCIRVRLQPGTSPAIVAAACRTQSSREWLIANSVGMTMLNINQQTLARLPLSIPPRQLHAAIERTLCSSQSSVEFLSSLISAKREQKRGLMQQLLTGKVRFPGFSEPWKTVRLEQVASLRNDKTIPSRESQIRCIELEHIEQGTGEVVGSAPASSTVSLKTAFQPGDVLFGKLRPYLKKFALVDFAGCCSTEIWALVADQSAVTPGYLRLLVESTPIQRSANATSGTKMPRADWDVVAATSVQLPPLGEQSRITAIIGAIESELRLLQQQRTAFATHRRGLMERLLSGDVALPSSDTSTA